MTPTLLETLCDALDRIESVREPDGFNATSRNAAEVRLAAIDYRASYREAREALDAAHAAITAAVEALNQAHAAIRAALDAADEDPQP